MSPWKWYWREADDDNFSFCEECNSRDEVIASASRELKPGDRFIIIEARMSEAKEHEGSDCVPFLRSRNREELTVQPRQ